MKRIIRIALLLLAFVTLSKGYGQTASADLLMPAERVYLHQNSTMLLSGEYLYYKVYVINHEEGQASDLSKMAYVQLIGRDGTAVFSHKIRLEEGMGQGDFFIPTSIASGNYMLVAYTHWMRNGSVKDFYQNDVVVINPFQQDQSGLLRTEVDSTRAQGPSTTAREPELSSVDGIKLEVDPAQLGSREMGTVRISGIPESWHGNYSLSVTKVRDLGGPPRQTAASFERTGQGSTKSLRVNSESSTKLPELRGELLEGRVVISESGSPASGRKVALSIAGTNYIFKISTTGEDGRFHFNLDQPYTNDEALIQVVGDDKENFRIELDPFETPDFSDLSFGDFTLTEEMEQMILDHSIQNQIQNAYAGTRVDSIRKLDEYPPFFGRPTHEYYLDDYTRFSTIKETITEIIEQASTRQRRGEQFIHVRVYDDDVESGLKSLLLIDGLFIQDHNTVVEAKASRIKKISVVSEQYLYGSEVFEGIISMESYEGDFIESLPQLKEEGTKLFRPELVKDYHKQDYRYKDLHKRVPDFRSQLVWEPGFRLDGASKTYSFYTSDLSGAYEVSIEGFNDSGKALSLKTVFRVD